MLGQLVRRLRAEYRFPISHGAVLGRLEREGPATTSAWRPPSACGRSRWRRRSPSSRRTGSSSARPDPTDGRQILIAVTERGRAMLAEDRARREGWLASVIAAELSAEEQEVLLEAIEILRRLARS